MTSAIPGDDPGAGEAGAVDVDAGPTRAARPPRLEPGDAPGAWRASGPWTVLALGDLAGRLAEGPGPGEARGGDAKSDGPGTRPAAAPALATATATATGRSPAAGPAPDEPAAVVVDGRDVDALDTVGALLLVRWAARGAAAGRPVDWQGWTPVHRTLIDRVARLADAPPLPAPPAPDGALARLGRETVAFLQEAVALLAFLGETAVAFAHELRRPASFRWRAVLHHVGVTGVSALPIVGLLGVLMGIVVTYQGAGQLTRYGANIFVVDLLGLSMLREFAPLVTAIIVAGRSGSAFAAQLGTMSVTEEIDALRTLGLSPIAVLVLPRLLALVIAMPLLTVFADALGLAGGMLMAALKLGVGFSAFMDRLPLAISGTTLMLGVGKAPVFAAIVAVVGCYQGLRTSGGADSVGRQTTRSVVQSIFLVIGADAVFSVAFSMLNL